MISCCNLSTIKLSKSIAVFFSNQLTINAMLFTSWSSSYFLVIIFKYSKAFLAAFVCASFDVFPDPKIKNDSIAIQDFNKIKCSFTLTHCNWQRRQLHQALHSSCVSFLLNIHISHFKLMLLTYFMQKVYIIHILVIQANGLKTF